MARAEVTESIEILLDPAFEPMGVTVLGWGLEDSVVAIDPRAVVRVHAPHVPCTSRSFGSGGDQIQRKGEPQLRPYPVAEKIQDVSEWGGWLDLTPSPGVDTESNVRLMVADGRVTDIELSGPWLSPLGLDEPAAIARRLGPNDRYGRADRRTTWWWPDRRLAITWNDEDMRLESISLGHAAGSQAPMFDALDLIRMVLGWKLQHPTDDWPLRPRYSFGTGPIEAGRIGALMSALQVFTGEPSLDGFFSGSFLDGAQHRTRMQALVSFLVESSSPQRHEHVIGSRGLQLFWRRMLEFRLHLEALTRFNNGVLEASGLYSQTVHLTNRVARKLEVDRDSIDHALALILDPAQREFTWGMLVREFDFPDAGFDHRMA